MSDEIEIKYGKGDPLYEEAVRISIESSKYSVSLLQRKPSLP